MTEDEFTAYREVAIPAYAAEHVKAGNWSSEEAAEKSRKSYEDTLPQGLETANHYLYIATDETSSEDVGVVWFMIDDRSSPRSAFLYELRIWERFRHRGYGRAAMQAMEVELEHKQVRRVALHVFGHNSIAIELYRSLGYDVVDLIMAKEVAAS